MTLEEDEEESERRMLGGSQGQVNTRKKVQAANVLAAGGQIRAVAGRDCAWQLLPSAGRHMVQAPDGRGDEAVT